MLKKISITALFCAVAFSAMADCPEWKSNALNKWRPVKSKKAMVDGILKLTDFGKDSSIRLGGLDITTADAAGIEIEYRAKNLPAKTTGQVFFIGEDHKYRGPFYLNNLKSDYQWRTVKLTPMNLRDPGQWTSIDKVATLRIDFMDQEGLDGSVIEVKRIAVTPKNIAPAATDTNSAAAAEYIWSGDKLSAWRGVRCKTELRGDVLVLSNIKRDCNIHVSNLAIKAADYEGIDFTYRASATPVKTNGQVFFKGDSGKYLGPFYLHTLKADGQWHTLKLRSGNLNNKAAWATAGTITYLRIDPMDQAGEANTVIEIKDIRVVPKADSGNKQNFNGVTLLRIPPVKKKPVIDGSFSAAEWSDTSTQFGGVSNLNGMLMWRWTVFFIGYDEEYLYFAQRSILPPKPMKITPEDRVELQIAFPGYPLNKIIFNSLGEGKLPAGTQLKSWYDKDDFWTSEMAIPLAGLGVKKINFDSAGKLQMIRHYRNVDETVSFHAASHRNPHAVFIPDADAPRVSFENLWLNFGRPGSSYRASWNVKNTTGSSKDVVFDIVMTSLEQPRVISKVSTLKPGAAESVQMGGQWGWDVIRHMRAEIRDSKSSKIYFQRYFHWDIAKVVRWRDPDPPYQFKIAVYPSYKRLRAIVSCPMRKKLDKIAAPEIKLQDAAGQTVAALPTVRRADGYLYDGALPELAEGEYKVIATFKNPQGKEETHSDRFTVKTFPWQNLNLGKDRIIVPPFKPLQVSGNTIRALQTGFKESVNGFWDAIYALDENILAAPVEFLINGQPLEAVAQRTLETSPDLVVTETDLTGGDLRLTLRREYEQDGFCKVYFKFNPVRPVTVKSMELKFPVKKSIAQYYFASGRNIRMNSKGAIPDADGMAFDSTKGGAAYPFLSGFRPYIWLGEYRKGLAYVCETPRYWGRAAGKPAQSITVQGDKAYFTLHMASAPVTYDKPCEIVMAFQPTPVKPRPAGSHEYITPVGPEYKVYPGAVGSVAVLPHNSVFFRYEDGMYVPPNNDWSFVEFAVRGEWKTEAEINEFVSNYFKRNNLSPKQFSMLRGPHSWWAKCPMDRYLRETAKSLKNARYKAIYGNARILSHTWEEFEVYADEWDLREWRPPRELNEFSTEPVPSFVDFTLHQLREELKHGLTGMYYDNIFEGLVRDPVTSAAFEEADGTLRPAFGIFRLRELVKRTAVFLHKSGVSYNGSPAIMLHMTDCPIIPVLSFAGLQLDWEMNFGGNVYQERFPLHYGIAASTGAQAGVNPQVLIDAKGCDGDSARVVKSAMAMAFIYNIISHSIGSEGKPLSKSPFYHEAMSKIFAHGYGRRDNVLYAGVDPANPVKITPATVKATTVKRADGGVLLLVGNLDGNTTARIDAGTLSKGEAVDLMSGQVIGQGGIYDLAIDKESFAVIFIKP